MKPLKRHTSYISLPPEAQLQLGLQRETATQVGGGAAEYDSNSNRTKPRPKMQGDPEVKVGVFPVEFTDI
ncbi:hypothetical protein KAREA_49580 (plasmid) [Prescottella equi]|nr:hypothetical protein KAREA_49580 [Prescottella equi]